MKLNNLGIFAISLVLTACASEPKKPFTASDEDINYYFTNQVIKVNPGVVTHADHGTVKYSDEPYKSDYQTCKQKVFSGKSFIFGNRTVSDPDVLLQMTDDKSYLFFQAMMGSKNLDTNSPMNRIFNDKAILAEMKKITPLFSDTLVCVKAKGWAYPSSKKK